MKRNQIASILVILLGAICFWLIVHNKKSTLKEGLRDFALSDTASITKLFLADKNNSSITLEKLRAGHWKLNGKYIARNDGVNGLLETMKKIEVKSPVPKAARENVIKALAAGGVKIEAYQGEKLVKIYYVGSETLDMLGTYMLLVDPETMENSSAPYVTYIPGFDGYLTTRFFTKEADWRDRAVFQYIPPEIKSVKVEFPRKPEDGFEIINLPGTKFEVRSLKENAPLQNIDTTAVKQYVSYFQNLQYEAFEKPDQHLKDSVVASMPLNIITITDMKGDVNTAKIFYKRAPPETIDQTTGRQAYYDFDRIYALVNKGADLVIVQYFTFGKLLQPITYFSPKNIVKK